MRLLVDNIYKFSDFAAIKNACSIHFPLAKGSFRLITQRN